MPHTRRVPTDFRRKADTGTCRLHWVDMARGLAIILVVLAHCWRGLANANLLGLEQGWLGYLDRFIYLFHMNAFFILAGSFLLQQAQRGTAGRYLGHLSLRLLYPLALWTYLFIALRVLAGASANAPADPAALLVLPLPPVDHLWFLWAMFLGMVFWGGLVRALTALGQRPVVWLILALAASLVWDMVEIPPTLVDWIAETLRHLPFLALGVALGFSGNWMEGKIWLPPRPYLWVPVAFIALGSLAQYAEPKSFGLNVLSALTTLLFLALAQPIARLGSKGRLNGVIRLLGQHSMAVFLAHTIFSAATRIALIKIGISDPSLHLILGTAIGLAGPLALALWAQRLRVTRLLGF